MEPPEYEILEDPSFDQVAVILGKAINDLNALHGVRPINASIIKFLCDNLMNKFYVPAITSSSTTLAIDNGDNKKKATVDDDGCDEAGSVPLPPISLEISSQLFDEIIVAYIRERVSNLLSLDILSTTTRNDAFMKNQSEIISRNNLRRGSIGLSVNTYEEFMDDVNEGEYKFQLDLFKRYNNRDFTTEFIKLYIDMVTLSGRDIKGDIRRWLQNSIVLKPEKNSHDYELRLIIYQNNIDLLVILAKQIRPLAKMSRWGVGSRLFLSACLIYFDFVTDALVTSNFFALGKTGYGQASLACVGLSLNFQVLLAFLQNYRRGWKKCMIMMLLGALNILPMYQSYQLFIGTEQVHGMDLFPPEVLLALLKATDLLFEALPESVIQLSSAMQSEWDQIGVIGWISLSSSFIIGGALISGASVSIERGTALKKSNPVYNWIPFRLSKYLRCLWGFYLFNVSFFFMNVFALSSVFLADGTLMFTVLESSAAFVAVCLYKHFVDKELFSLALVSKPNKKVDIVLGIIIKFCYFGTTFLTMYTQAK